MFACLQLLGYLCIAQDGDIVFSPVEGRQQLNEEQIRNITRLPDGRLVVITEGMVNLYDGAGFSTIHIDDESTTPLADYRGYHHCYIENNRLWFKNMNRLALINLSKEQCEPDPLQALKKLGFEETPVDFFADSRQNIWIITDSGKLLCRDNHSGNTYTFCTKVTSPEGVRDAVYDIINHDNRLYIFYRSGLMRCFDPASARELFRENMLAANRHEYDATLFVVPAGKYLYQIRNGAKGQLTRFNIQTKRTSVILETPYWLNYLAADEQQNFWVACREGMWYFAAGATTGRFYPELQLADGKRISNEISTVFYDQQGGLWAGTLNKGLYYYHPDRFRFRQYGKSFFRLPEPATLQVTCFEEMPDGQLLVGTMNGLFSTSLPIDRAKPFKPVLPGIQCHAAYRDRHGTVWIAASQGLYAWQPGGKWTRLYPHDTRYVYETGEGELYIGTYSNGLLQPDSSSKTFKTICSGDQLPGIKQITSWNNELTGISAKGLFIINPGRTTVNYPLLQGESRMPMFRHSNHQYTSLLQDSDRCLWMATYDGLNMWDESRNQLYQLHTEDGLVNNSIKAILEDKDHSIWVTTSRGISHIFKNRSDSGYRFRIVNYNTYDGVIEHTFSERSVFLSSGQILFTGGVDGMNAFREKPGVQEPASLSPVLLSFSLFGKEVKEGKSYNGRVLLNRSIASTDTLTLQYNQNFFSISFSGLNYINPTQTYYRYMLEGVDRDWRTEKPLYGIGEAGYTNLDPGKYTFKVLAGTDGLSWPGKPKNILVIISPPFWQTIYAKLFYFAMAITLAWVLARYISRRNRQQRQKEQAAAVEKAKSEFMTNISHELRTPLTLIITPVRALIAKVTDQSVKADLVRIGNNAGLLLDTVNQLLDFKKLDAGSETADLHYTGTLLFIKEICDGHVQAAAEKNIHFTRDIWEDEVAIWIDRQKVTRIITNLLSNAFRFTPPGGTVSITVSPDETEGRLFIKVQDTGVGIAEAELDRIFDRFYQAGNQDGNNTGSGIGLYLVREYARLHGGRVNVTSIPGKGSCFEVTLSVKEKPASPMATNPEQPGQTLLIVEDHVAFREYLCRELMTDYSIVTAGNGQEGLQKALEHTPDLIITDMMMPEMTGPEFCHALRQDISISHTPVIMLTARTSDEARFEGYASGADAYLVKPFDMELLRLRISKLLQLSEVRKQAFDKEKEVKAETITSNPPDRALLERALECVRENLSNPDYSVEKFSMDMHMDRTGLYRKLMALTGHSPTNFIRAIRLKKAAGLLLEKKMPVSDIATAVGFNSVSYFTKCFHEAFGKPPSQYEGESSAGRDKV